MGARAHNGWLFDISCTIVVRRFVVVVGSFWNSRRYLFFFVSISFFCASNMFGLCICIFSDCYVCVRFLFMWTLKWNAIVFVFWSVGYTMTPFLTHADTWCKHFILSVNLFIELFSRIFPDGYVNIIQNIRIHSLLLSCLRKTFEFSIIASNYVSTNEYTEKILFLSKFFLMLRQVKQS